MTEQEYIDYFEGLASKHRAIRHDPAGRKAFYVVHDDNLTELMQAIPEMALPALLLDQYYDELDTENDNNRLRVLGGVSVICKVEPGNRQSVRDGRAEARRIVRSILNRVKKDCRYGGALASKTVLLSNSFSGEPTGIMGGTATGWGYPFTLQMPTSTAVVADDWLDQ